MNDTCPKLIQLIHKKEAEILKLLDKTKEQRNAISEDNIEKLISITDSKQEIIDYIGELDKEFKENYLLSQTDEKFENTKSLLMAETERIISITLQIKEIELENKKELQDKMHEIEGHIRQIRNGKKGIKAYFNMMPQSMYIDNKN